MKLIERHIAALDQRLVILAPPAVTVPTGLGVASYDSHVHRARLNELQRLRGSVYLEDGAVAPEQLTAGGLHRTPEDSLSWHFLILDKENRVSACSWLMPHPKDASFEQLRLRNCALNRESTWRKSLWTAVESQLVQTRRDGMMCAEAGGWAVSAAERGTTTGLLLILATYSLCRAMGDAIVLTNATVRNASSTILRRIGGHALQVGERELPPYYDPKYKCVMELMQFDSRRPEAKFEGAVEMIRERLSNVPVVLEHMPLPAMELPTTVPAYAS